MYGNEPYLVKNKSTVELVLFHPDQVQDFFKEDARCAFENIVFLLPQLIPYRPRKEAGRQYGRLLFA